MEDVNGDQNGYTISGSRAGPHYPSGYKYGGLALQAGGWATGRQPVTVKRELTGKKPKL